jgi:tetratricopeptide (TPR) repeat protein
VGATSEEAFAGISRLRAVWYALGHHASSVFLLEEPTAKYLPQPWPPRVPSALDFAALALLALFALACWRLRGQAQRAAVFGSLFAVLTYLPSASLLVPLTRYLADSYVYLPELGVGIVFAAGFERMRELAGARLARLLAATPWVIGVLLGASFLLSSARFSDDLSLWSHAHQRFPHHAHVCRQWSNAVVTAKGPSAGLDAIDRCIAEFGDALFVKNRGITLAQLGRFDEARAALLRAQRDAPEDAVIARYLREIEAQQHGQDRARQQQR